MRADRPPVAWAALTALTGLNLVNYLDRQVMPAVLTPMKAELGLSDSQLGTAYFAFMLGYFATAPLFGVLGDRLPRKGLIALGVAVWSLGTALSGWAPGYVSLLGFRVLVGLGEASYGTLSPSWIADLYPAERRNLRISIFYLATPVGSALGYLLGGAIAARFGWRCAFFAAGLPGLLLALGVLRLKEPARGASEPPGRPAGQPGGFRAYARLIRLRDYRLVVAGYVAQTFAMGAFAFWAPTFLQRAHGMSLEAADRFFGGWLVLTGLAATLLGGAAATALRRRFRSGYAWTLAASAIATVPAAFAAFALHGRGASEAALVAAMFLIFLPTGPINTLILETVPSAVRGCAMAAAIFAIHLGGDLWSAKLVGMVSDRLGSLQAAILGILPASTLLCAVLWTWLALSPSPSDPAEPPPPGAGDLRETTS